VEAGRDANTYLGAIEECRRIEACNSRWDLIDYGLSRGFGSLRVLLNDEGQSSGKTRVYIMILKKTFSS